MSHVPSRSFPLKAMSACCALWRKHVWGSNAYCSLGGKIAIVLCLLP